MDEWMGVDRPSFATLYCNRSSKHWKTIRKLKAIAGKDKTGMMMLSTGKKDQRIEPDIASLLPYKPSVHLYDCGDRAASRELRHSNCE
ncbi:MAG: hypothetical protein NVS3B14_01020 [Ktedonobacteraceae bacterium]